MSTYADPHTDTRRGTPYLPAYGPVEAVLGFALFYVLVDRATPALVDIAADLLPGVAPGAVQLATALALWFILVVTAIDQFRRQLAALGVATHDQVDPDPATRQPPSEPLALGYLVAFVFASGIAVSTADRGIDAAITVFAAVARLDVAAIVPAEVVLVVVFVVAFNVAARCLDRLLVGGVRWLLTDWR